MHRHRFIVSPHFTSFRYVVVDTRYKEHYFKVVHVDGDWNLHVFKDVKAKSPLQTIPLSSYNVLTFTTGTSRM